MSGNSPQKYYQSFKQGCALPRKARQMCLNVYSQLRARNRGEAKNDIVTMTSELCGVGTSTVKRLKQKFNASKSLSPCKKREKKRNYPQKCDEFAKNAIRRKMHSFFFQNKLPTLKKVLAEIKKDPELPDISKTTLHKILTKDLNFRFLNRNRNSKLIDREDIIAWRCRYLRQIKKYREEGRHIYYLDETWCNAGHTFSKVWQDTAVKSSRDAFLQGLSTGLQDPSGKGKRLIILHIGSSEGWVPDGELIFVGEKRGDYHDEMNAQVFENWMMKTLPKLKEQSVIVFDNASYHSARAEKLPTSAWKKAEIAEWLKSKGEVVEDYCLKAELWQMTQELKKHVESKYVVDEMVEATGRKVLRLPPYHCELNPIELVWATVKGYVAANNTTFKISDVRTLVEAGIKTITKRDWENAISHVINKVEIDMRKMDNILDDLEERIIVHLGEDSDDSDDDSDDDEDDEDLEKNKEVEAGVEPLSL